MTCEERDPQRPNYEIRVRGHLGADDAARVPGASRSDAGRGYAADGCLQDQAAMYGVLARLEALGLELLELRRLPG